MSRKIFINLAVSDLQRSVDFFTALGFTFNANFTDDTATCMIVSEEAYVMLLTQPRFAGFTTRPVCDSTTHTEGMFALSADSREEVDAFMAKALAAGGTQAMPVVDMGFMYGHSFYDPDGHHWEIFWMDTSAAPPE